MAISRQRQGRLSTGYGHPPTRLPLGRRFPLPLVPARRDARWLGWCPGPACTTTGWTSRRFPAPSQSLYPHDERVKVVIYQMHDAGHQRFGQFVPLEPFQLDALVRLNVAYALPSWHVGQHEDDNDVLRFLRVDGVGGRPELGTRQHHP